MTLKEDFQRAIAQSQKGKSAGGGINRPNSVFSGVDFNTPSKKDIALVHNALKGRIMVSAPLHSSGSNDYYNEIRDIDFTVDAWVIKIVAAGVFILNGEEMRSLCIDGEMSNDSAVYRLKEDFQRAIAQSQQGKSAGGGINRPEEFSEDELAVFLIGKQIKFYDYHAKTGKVIVDMGFNKVTKVEPSMEYEDEDTPVPGFQVRCANMIGGWIPAAKAKELIANKRVTFKYPAEDVKARVTVK